MIQLPRFTYFSVGMNPSFSQSLAQFLALNRTVAIVLLTVLLFGLGEELWSPFFPTYLRALDKQSVGGAADVGTVAWSTLWLVGIYGLLRNLFEGFCFIGGGHLTARLGDRGSLLLFGVLTITGYVLFLTIEADWAAILAALLSRRVGAAFSSGDIYDCGFYGAALAREWLSPSNRFEKRLPKIVGPALAGLVIGFLDEITGMRLLVFLSLGLAVVTIFVQWRWMPHREDVGC